VARRRGDAPDKNRTMGSGMNLAKVRDTLQANTNTKIKFWVSLNWYDMIYNMIYMIYLTAIGLPSGGGSTIHIYTHTIHRTTESTQTIHRTTQFTSWEECGPCPVFARYTLAFALQLRKKHGKPSVRVAEECQLARWKQNIQNRTYI
jgi:hypothetical protein